MNPVQKCIGHRIQGGLQANCPVKKTCLKYLNSRPGDELKQPKMPITASGCGEYKRLSIFTVENGIIEQTHGERYHQVAV